MLNYSTFLTLRKHHLLFNEILINSKRLLFFFKFIKLKKFYTLNNKIWFKESLTAKKKTSIKLKLWSKKKIYKPYNTFKFKILKYQRFFLPKYWFFFNSFLATRYNYLTLNKKIISKNIITKIVNINLINTVKIPYLLKLTTRYNLFQLKAFLTYQPITLRLYQYKKKGIVKKIKINEKERFGYTEPFVFRLGSLMAYISRKQRKVLKYKLTAAHGSTKVLNKSYRFKTKFFNIKKPYRRFFRKFFYYNKSVFFIKNTPNPHSVSWLTNVNFTTKNNQLRTKSFILGLKILFNSYNYKTFNWRILI